MTRIHMFLASILISTHTILIANTAISENVQSAYTYNPYATPHKWNRFAPHFIPENHPVKEKLDQIFLSSNKRILKDKKSLKKAKFKVIHHEKKKNPYVAKHPEIPGYLFKVYFDSQKDIDDGRYYLYRIWGAHAIRQAINRNCFQEIFKVPRKWIYPIPLEAVPPQEGCISPKNFILVVEDMDIYGWEKNLSKWKSKAMTPELLEAIYILLDEVGLSDTVYAFNLPFCKDGKLAFIDTEYHHDWPVDFMHLARYLCTSMKHYWISIIEREKSK